jgi:hypothetical protein
MKAPVKITGLFLAMSFLFANAHGQGVFLNLGFELTPTDLGSGSGTDYYSIPYWSATMYPYQGGVTLNNYVLDATTLSLQSGPLFSPIGGATSLLLTASSFGYPLSTASISQTGLVPSTAQSLKFKVADILTFQLSPNLPGQFFVTMNGENVGLQVIANNGNYTELAGNISTWAGQTASLSIGINVPASQSGENYFQALIDDISFSSTSVPEPTTTVLAVLAGGGWLLCRRIRHG